jgi:glycosyltransferase involved in cell wall biosynthesis
MGDKLRILYATGRYSPLDHDAGSGEDFNLYQAFSRENCEIRIVGPLKDTPSLAERVYRKVHSLVSRKRFAKYSAALMKANARAIEADLMKNPADVLFSHNLSAFVKLKTDVPIVLLMDAPLLGTEKQWPLFSKLEFRRMLAWEQAVLDKCAMIITRSEWTRDILIKQNHVPAEKIVIFQAASSLPESIIPKQFDYDHLDLSTLKLLLVGRVYRLKGIDIAIEVTEKLNRLGIKTELRIVGMEGENTEYVHFMGSYQKADEKQLAAYAEQYKWAHFLLHPARYDSAPIVTAEAAAFGVPTISDAVGGIATTVKTGVSGVVLPMLSPADEYVKVFQHYVSQPQEYADLRRSTRTRYEKELNWKVVGSQVYSVLEQTARKHAGTKTKKGKSL